MIDIENQVYTAVANKLRESFPGINVSGEYVREPAKFPHVSIEEKDNYVLRGSLDTGETEKFASVMYEITIYSNRQGQKKQDAKDILEIVDSMMYSMNFVRTAKTPVPNLENATIYRLVARYEAVTDGERIYRK